MTLEEIEEMARANAEFTLSTTTAALALAVLAMLPVVKAAEVSTDMLNSFNRENGYGDKHRHRIADAIDTMRATLGAKR